MGDKNGLSKNHTVVFRIWLLYMSEIIGLFVDDVATPRRRRHRIVKSDLGQVKVWVDGSDLL